MSNIRKSLFPIFLIVISACDIVPVSVGVWDIAIETNQGVNNATWTITDEPSLVITGANEITVEEIDLAGSRIIWSGEGLNLPGSTPTERVNFRGTVDGNRLAGTVFTQQGNYTVTGTRQ